MMEKKWIITHPHQDPHKVRDLSTLINVSNPIASLLLQRSIETYEDAQNYFRPSLKNLYDPFMMLDMEAALARLIQAIDHNERILIYGDYDVDGTTSTAMLYTFIKKIHPNIDFYIPDRHSEGYGVSLQSIDWASENNINLIITIDCGIKAIDPVAKAKEQGIDFIICDHHEPGATLPNAHAILNPKQNRCNYPFKELSGAGVGFKFIQAIARHKKIKESETHEYLDLVAISIASDIVPMIDENRTLAYHGLKLLNNTKRIGLIALLEAANLLNKPKEGINIANISFKIAPRINASGRVGCARKVVNLLISDDKETAKEIAKTIEKKNNLRKEIDKEITQEVFSTIESNNSFSTSSTITLYNEKWNKGVLGIVAAKCIEKYYKPTIILTHSNDKITGSARSVAGYNIYNSITKCSNLLENYGGHAYAAGLTLKKEHFENFQKTWEETVSQEIDKSQLTPKIYIDLEISLDAITPKMLSIIEQMAPFGPSNTKPLFTTKNVTAINHYIVKDEHLKLSLQQEGSNTIFDAIAFGLAQHKQQIDTQNPFSIVYTIERNTYLGVNRIQLNIRDIKYN
jgi:single-stranded-DNA-specific exonuclease